ncbi:MAG: endolytic transglycosylase MltG [bacterium]
MYLWQISRKKIFFAIILLAAIAYLGYYLQERAAQTPLLRAEVMIVFPEGMTMADMGKMLEEKELFQSAEFMKYKDRKNWPDKWLADYPFLRVAKTLEGYLFPDTYRFYAVTTPEVVAQRFLNNFKDKTKNLGEPDGSAEDKLFGDLIVMASVLEKEVRHPRDMAMVADIFWKRVNVGRGLESDSTLNYILDTGRASLTAKDLQTDSPYNTYKYKGLPPTPIANPGMNAMNASWHPQANEYWYFLTDGEGNVHYGKTLEEHNSNKQKYLK